MEGAIVNVASIAGLRPELGLGPYGVTKAALIMLSRQLASDEVASVIAFLVSDAASYKGAAAALILRCVRRPRCPPSSLAPPLSAGG